MNASNVVAPQTMTSNPLVFNFAPVTKPHFTNVTQTSNPTDSKETLKPMLLFHQTSNPLLTGSSGTSSGFGSGGSSVGETKSGGGDVGVGTGYQGVPWTRELVIHPKTFSAERSGGSEHSTRSLRSGGM